MNQHRLTIKPCQTSASTVSLFKDFWSKQAWGETPLLLLWFCTNIYHVISKSIFWTLFSVLVVYSVLVREFTVKWSDRSIASMVLQMIGTKAQLRRTWHNQGVINLKGISSKTHRQIRLCSLSLLDYRVLKWHKYFTATESLPGVIFTEAEENESRQQHRETCYDLCLKWCWFSSITKSTVF